MASLAAPARQPRTPEPQPRPARPAAHRRAATRPRVAGSIVWIVVVALLLAGIVALNVAVLRMNMQAEEVEARTERLTAQRDALAAELSTAAAAGRIQAIATGKLGLVRPVETTYVRLARAKR